MDDLEENATVDKEDENKSAFSSLSWEPYTRTALEIILGRLTFTLEKTTKNETSVADQLADLYAKMEDMKTQMISLCRSVNSLITVMECDPEEEILQRMQGTPIDAWRK